MRRGQRLFDISFKCPKCFREIPRGNRFCIYCGSEIATGVSSAVQEEAPRSFRQRFFGTEEPAQEAPAWQEEEPVLVKACPNGHDVPDPSLGFCLTCGAPLVDRPQYNRRR